MEFPQFLFIEEAIRRSEEMDERAEAEEGRRLERGEKPEDFEY
ncbi:MAG: hypothetical protein AABY22_20845 [Nanoarchaeota archaeon]